MPEQSQENNSVTLLSAKDDMVKTNTIIAYLLLLLGITGILWFIGIIWTVLKKEDAAGSIFADHYTSIMTTVWWSLGLSIISFFFTIIAIGYPMLLCVFIWYYYRMVKGLVRVTAHQAYN